MQNFEIKNSTQDDIDDIFRLYHLATELMKSKFIVHWPEFERSMVETEIHEHRQWKMMIDEKIACVWAIAFSDPLIWESRDEDPAIYIHRIATAPEYRGNNFVVDIVAWSKQYAAENGKKFVRLDTVGENQKLIQHYTKCGFEFLGLSKLKQTTGLPAHYDNATVSLFEIKL